MTRFIQTMAIRLSCVVFLVITAVFYITVLVTSASAAGGCVEDTIRAASAISKLDTVTLIVEPDNAETIATSISVMWMTGLIEVNIEYIVRTPCHAM